MAASAVWLLLVLPGALAGPVQWQAGINVCSTHCPESSKYNYEVGASYEYSYEAETRTTMAGAAEDTATITITATAVVEVLGSCDMALKLTNVAIRRSHEENTKRMVEADDMSRARRALEGEALRFAFYDGSVGELCPGRNQDLWALNVKRGVLTSFQNSMRQLDHEEHVKEADVTGSCPTHYKVTQKGWKMLTVSKVKDLLSCTDRNGYRTSLMSAHYQSPNSLQSLPLMKSSHECEHDISQTDSILQRSNCQEVHVFRPFSKARSGAVTEASHTLAFQRKSSGIGTTQGPVDRRTTLVYEHKLGMIKGDSVFTDVKNKLQEMCDVTKVDIRPQVPHIFGDLVHMMRSLDYSDLQSLDRQLQDNSVCDDSATKTRKFFQDALPMAATGASLRMMSDLLMSSEVKDAQATFWLTSLAFLPNPAIDMIAAVTPLLSNGKTQEGALLAVSSLVNNYCQASPTCAQEDEVQNVLDVLTGILGDSCSVDDNNFKQVLLTLRAIGNIGQSEVTSLRLQPCFTQSDLPMDVRVAALDAYRRMPCTADRNDVMEMFRRHSEDSELRVAAYLAVMKCPSDPVLTQVRQALMDEEVNQVGSFVWTHLTNLLETDSPHKQAIRDVLENELLQAEFRKDRRKYSRNYELSVFSEKFNLGGIYESNVIWSPKSFIPRSAMMNLTVDMFGHSVNLLEVGGRVQGLEYLLENYFGPSSKESAGAGGYGATNIVKSEKMASTKKKFGQVKDDLRAQLYLRVLGNELSYSTLDGSDVGKLRQGNARSFFSDLLDKLVKSGKVSVTQSSMFLDTSIVIPTVTGLPLNLTVNGSASVELQASQKIDFRKINAKSKAFKIEAAVEPSGAVEFSSMMSVDAFVTQVGLKMTSRLHTSTAMNGRVELARGQIFSVEIDTPRDTLELFDFQSKFYIVHDSWQKEQQMVTAERREKRACSGEPLAKVIGVELCASLSFPNATTALSAPYFPFTGPTHVAVTVQKHDVHSGYRLFAKQIQTSNSVISQLALDTPGSREDRAISLGYVVNIKDMTLEADLLSPWKKAAFKVNVDNSKKSHRASGVLTLDATDEYKVEMTLDKDIKDRKAFSAKLKPTLTITSPQGTALSVTGNLDYRQNRLLKTNVVVNMKDVLKKSISLDYALFIRGKADKQRYKTTLKLSSQFATVGMTSHALVGSFSSNKRSALLTLRSRMDYNLHILPQIRRNIVNLGVKINDKSTKALRKYGVSVNFAGKQTPEADLSIKAEMSHKATLTEVEVKARQGKNIKVKDTNKEMVLAGVMAHNIKLPKAKVSFDIKAIYPDKDVDYQLTGKHEHDRRSLEDYLTVRYAKGKSVDAHLLMAQSKKKRSATFDLSYPSGRSYPARDVKINADLVERTSSHHVFSALASLQKGEKNSMVVSFKQPTPTSVDVSSEVGLHGRQPVKLDLAGNFALRGMAGRGQLTAEGKTYSLNFTSDIEADRYATFALNAVHPDRRITARLEGGKDAEEAVKRAKVQVLWDADHDPTQKVGATMELADTVQPDDVNIGGMMEVYTPVPQFSHLKAQLNFENSQRRILTVAETVYGDEDKKYSAKFLLRRPISRENFKTVLWLKSPHQKLRHAEVSASHSIDDAGLLTTAVKTYWNGHFVDAGITGSMKEDLVVRLIEGSVYLRSSLQPANLRLSFNHRDSNGHYTAQTVLDYDGDQYSAGMEADFIKVHLQVTTSGTVTLRVPHLTAPAKLTWTHSNSLHDVTSSVTLNYEDNQEVHFEVYAKANIVSNIYDGRMLLRGPWKEGRQEHESLLAVHYEQSSGKMYDISVDLTLDSETYVIKHKETIRSDRYERSTGLTMSRFPEYSFLLKGSSRFADFPYTVSITMEVADMPRLDLDVEIENPKNKVYRSNCRMVLHLDESTETVSFKARHTKNNKNQWMTKGDLEYEIGSTVSFNNVLDYESERKHFELNVGTPYEEVRNINFEYSHSLNANLELTGVVSLSAQPQFDTIRAEVHYSNNNMLNSTLRLDTPFHELRFLEAGVQSHREDSNGVRTNKLMLNYAPDQLYKLDLAYNEENFLEDFGITLNVSTPLKELPSLFTELGWTYMDDAVTGLFKLRGPVTDFEELMTSFGHRRGPGSLSTQLDAVTSPGRSWSGRANLDWVNEIAGTVRVSNSEQGPAPFELELAHRGHTWQDFRTKGEFKMNGDRLATTLAYSQLDGRSGEFMLATPDPDLDFFRTTFFQRLTASSFEGQYTGQYGEESKPYELGLTTTFSDAKVGFTTDLKTPQTEDLAIEVGFSTNEKVQVKLLGMYGYNNKIDTLVKYVIQEELWDVGGELEYLVRGSGRDIGLTFLRDGPLSDLKVVGSSRYMGHRVTVDTQYKDADKKSGSVRVTTSFADYTDVMASFDHSGDSTAFVTDLYLRYQDDQVAKANVDFSRRKWRRVAMTTTFNLPLESYRENKLTYKHTYSKNKLSSNAILKLGAGHTITGELDLKDNSHMTLSVTGPFKDFESLTAQGVFDEADLRFEGTGSLQLLSQSDPITSSYTVAAGIWPVMVNFKVQTPFDGWSNVELSTTHDGGVTDFTTSSSLMADAIGSVTMDTIFKYTSPSVFDGKWTLTSSVERMEDLKLFVKNSQVGNEYNTQLIVGWELLKEIVLDASVQIGDGETWGDRYKGSMALTSPFQEMSQASLAFDHRHSERRVQDSVITRFNDETFMDADFTYTVDERRSAILEFREPRPMEFMVGGQHRPSSTEGELKLNWDKRVPEMNIHFSGDYADRTDQMGTDKALKVWVVHPARSMGVEYLLKQADKEFQTDFLLTWDKSSGQTLSYIVNWTDRSSVYSTAYDAMVKVGVPMRSVQVEGTYTGTGRARAAEGSVMWDADNDKNMKLGLKGQVDQRGKTNKVSLGLDLPFADKEYSLATETAVNSGNTVLDQTTEFSYSTDPRKLVVITTRIDDLSYGSDATNYSLAFSVVHPMTDVNIKLTTHVGDSQSLSSLGSKVEYLTSDRQRKMVELRGQIDKLRRLLVVELKCPLKNVALEGRLSGDSNYNVRLAVDDDGRRSEVADIFMDPEAKTFEMAYRYDRDSPSSSLNLFSLMVDGDILQTEVYRMEQGQRVSETLMMVRLNSSHVLHTRLNWRPSMLQDLQRYLSTQLTVYSYSSSEVFKQAAQAVGAEVEAKYLAIMQEVREEAAPLLQQLQREMGQLQDHMSIWQRDIRRFYNSNHLNVQDMGQIVNDGMEAMISGLQYLEFGYGQMFAQVQQDIAQAMQDLGQFPMAQRYAQLVQEFAAGIKNSRMIVEQALHEVTEQLNTFSESSYARYIIISRRIQRKLEGYTAALRQTPQYQGLSQAYNSAQSTLTTISQGNYQQMAEAANLKLLAALDDLGIKDAYVLVVSRGKQLIADQFQDLVARPEFQQIYVVSTELYQQGVWAYHYWQVENNTRLAVARLLELAKDVTLLEVTRIKNAVVDLDKSRVIVFDPQNGELQFEIYLPVPLKSLTEAPDMRLTKYVNRVKSWVSTYIPWPRHSFWTSVNNYFPDSNPDTWTPPYTATAYVMGDKHVVTFDKKHYNFAGRCSYILARDMADDRFTVVLNYNNRPRQPQVQSLVIMLRGVSFEVTRDNKVKVNRRETELPYFSGAISAVHDQGLIRIVDDDALVVEIDSDRGIYSVAVSGWYHGRTAGLLGIYDNEPFNDMTDSRRQQTSDAEAFSNSWEVSSRYCRSRNLANVEPLDRQLPEVQGCERHLNHSSSYYAPCFGQVEAGELVSVCVDYVRTGLSLQEAQCMAGQQYRYMCHRRGVSLRTPSQCVTCTLSNGDTVTGGGSVTLNSTQLDGAGSQPSADVVFVVEENRCNSWAQRSLSTLATQLAQSLQDTGLTGSRFGLVSYSGNGSHDPQLVHTIEGEMFGDPGNFLKATENLRLTHPGSPADVGAALREAMKYPFRVGVAKMLVLLPCSACGSDLVEVTQVLRTHGFQLHVLSAQEFEVAGSSGNNPVRVFGLDAHTAHTQRSAARNSGALYQQLQQTPRDACGRLALATNGSVFDVKHMSQRGRIQSEFLESFAARGALNARARPSCQVCSCHDDGNGRGHTVCRLCDYESWLWNHIPTWLQSQSTSVMGVFNDVHHQLISSLRIPNVAVSA